MTQDMTTGSPLRRILAFCWPLLLGNLFQQGYNLADSILVGRILGVNSFAAVGSTGALSFLVMGFALGVSSGFAIPVAQRFGAGDEDGVRKKTGQLLWLGLLSTLLIMGLTAFFTDDILRATQTPAEIFDEANRYIRLIFLGSGATILYNMTSALLRALGDSKTPLLFLTAAVVGNIALDVLFMGPMGLGVEGAALATVLSQLVSGLLCLHFIATRMPILHLRREDLRPNGRLMASIAVIGVPMGLQFSITAIGSILVQSALNSLGTVAVAAVAAGTKVHTLISAPFDTCGAAMATYCGQNLGAGRLDRVRAGVRDAVLLCFGYSALAFAFNWFGGAWLTNLFLAEPEAEITQMSWQYLVATGAGYPLLTLIFIYRNALQGMGFSVQAMGAGLAELAARMVAALALVSRYGFAAICLASPLAWLLADGLLLALYARELHRLEKPQLRLAPVRR